MPSLLNVAMASLLAAGLGQGALAQPYQPGETPIRVQLFSEFTEDVGKGITFGNLVAEQGAQAIDFGIPANWWPLGEPNAFGAWLTSGLQAGQAGSYTLSLGSDDASYLFIDDLLVLALPQAHSYYTQQVTVALAPGYHSLSLQFYNSFCCGSVLTLDPGGLEYVTAAPVPEPGSLPLWLAGLGTTGWALRRRLAPAG